MFSILSKLENIIFSAFNRYELEEQKTIHQVSRGEYTTALHQFFTEVIIRIDDSRFLNSFYDDVTSLYFRLENNEVFISKIIKNIVDLFNEDKEIKQEILISGRKNSFDLIINYTLDLLENVINLTKVDSSKLLQLVNFYNRYDFIEKKPNISQLKKSDQPQRLIRERFIDIHKRKVYTVASYFISAAKKINSTISDSSDYSENNFFKKSIPSEILKQSWGGEGYNIYSTCRDLDILSRYFGRTEDSIAGEIQLVDKYLALLKASSFGSLSLTTQEFYISGTNFFGKFNSLFSASGESKNSTWGLEFLRPLVKTRAYQSVDPFLDPVDFLFRNGIKDRLGEEKIGRKVTTTILPISLYINRLLKRAKQIGNYALSLLNSLDSNGRLKYYEGLGNLKYPLQSLVAVFPVATITCRNNYSNSGIVGALENLLISINGMQNHIELGSFPGKTLEEIVPWLDSLRNKIEVISNTIKTIGYKAGDFLPDIPLQVSGRTREDYTRYFKSIGYPDNKIEKILNSRNLNDLVVSFEDRMSSADVKSFFRGYDLAKFVYSIAGEEGINSVKDYLTSPNEEGLARLFILLDVKPDRFLKLDQYKYGKLIGTLLSVEKASNSTNIEKLIPYFKAKNSTIGQSLKIVADFGLDYPIRDNIDIPVLDTMINQLSKGFSTADPFALDFTCKETLVDAPESLRQWIELIDRSRGTVDTNKLIGLLENSSGITYSQLGDILNSQESPGFSVLSGILEGYQGGEFTRILKDIYKSGLAVLMRSKSAYSQKTLNKVQEDTDDLFIGLVTNLEGFSLELQLINYRLLISSEDNISTQISSERSSDYSLIVDLINKPLNNYPILIKSLAPDTTGRLPYNYNKTLLRESINSNGVSEPPGIGNSPRITRNYQEGVLSPELAALLETTPTVPVISSVESIPFVPLFKIDKDNLSKKRFSNIKPSSTTNAAISFQQNEDIGSGNEEYRDGISIEPLFTTSKTNYFDPLSDYITEKFSANISIPITGSYYITNEDVYDTSFSDPNLSQKKYNPINSCIEFGTSEQKCRQLFKDYQEVGCKEYLYNKSSLVEPTPIMTALNPGAIPLGRPLGITGALNPSGVFLPNSYKRLPYYIEEAQVTPLALSPLGEPFGVEFSLGGAPGWENTSIGINYFLNNNPRPKNEQECSKYNELSDLQKCLNALKCIRLKEKSPSFCNGVKL